MYRIILLVCLVYFAASDALNASVSDHELSTLMTSLWNQDYNGASSSDVTYNIQSNASTHSSTDNAHHRFFTYLNEAHLFQKPTYSTFIALLDNYYHDATRDEHVTSAKNAEVTRFIDEIMKTAVMESVNRFLQSKGYVTSTTQFKQQLETLWFSMYSRSGHAHGSSGFEHVFVGETLHTKVSGFHNWIQFYLEEKKGHLNYLGYVFTRRPREIGVHFTWYGDVKPLSTLLIGTSPEFDMAVLTTCFYARKGRSCKFNMAGYHLTVISYDIRYESEHPIGTAYYA